MLKLILETPFLTILLILLAIAAPVGAVMIGRRWPDLLRPRQRVAFGALGPLLLGLAVLQAVLMRVLGFDSFFGMIVLMASGLGAGIALGLWVRAEPVNPPRQTAAAPLSRNPPD